MDFFVHPQGICESLTVGKHTRVWAFAHVLPGAKIGMDCNICAFSFIENDVIIGDRVTVKTGVHLFDGLRVEDDVFIGPNAAFTNDIFPRSKKYPERFLQTFIRKGASIGANATIMPGIEIGERAMVGAGSVVLKSVPPNAIVVGNPSRIIGYVDESGDRPKESIVRSSRKSLVRIVGVWAAGITCFVLFGSLVGFALGGNQTAAWIGAVAGGLGFVCLRSWKA